MKKNGKFLVTDEVPDGFIAGLTALGFDAVHIPKPTNVELYDMIAGYAGLVVNTSLIMDKRMLDKATQLKYILRPGSGLDNIDLEACRQKNILVLSSPEANSDAVAEHAIGLLLGLLNHIPRSFEQVKNGQWIRKGNTGTLLRGKTVGIIGYGNTGSALAAKLSGFGVRILVYDKYKKGFGSDKMEESDMETLFGQADILSLHVPLTPETHYLMNKDFLGRFAKPFYLLNTSRGGVVDLDALIWGLESGKLSGAALDVIENEDFSTFSLGEKQRMEKLSRHENLIITPHIAGWTKESRRAIFMLVLEKFEKHIHSLS